MPSINSHWIADWNGLVYQVTHIAGHDVYIARPDGADPRMLMIEKFRQHLTPATR